jgi:hypothetical protein
VPSCDRLERAIAVPVGCLYLLKSMTKFPTPFLLASAALVACSRSSPETAGSASSTATTATTVMDSNAATATGAAKGSPCPRTGMWALCSVEKRLEQSGFVVKRVAGEAPRRSGFSVAAAVYTLGRSRLEVFIYPSESALSADVAKIDTVSVTPRGVANSWETAPTFVRSGNLAAVFLTDNGTQAERLTLALTAGAPQR